MKDSLISSLTEPVVRHFILVKEFEAEVGTDQIELAGLYVLMEETYANLRCYFIFYYDLSDEITVACLIKR